MILCCICSASIISRLTSHEWYDNNNGTSKVSPQQRTRVQMSPEAQNDIKMHFYDFYQINLYVFNKLVAFKILTVEIGARPEIFVIGRL